MNAVTMAEQTENIIAGLDTDMRPVARVLTSIFPWADFRRGSDWGVSRETLMWTTRTTLLSIERRTDGQLNISYGALDLKSDGVLRETVMITPNDPTEAVGAFSFLLRNRQKTKSFKEPFFRLFTATKPIDQLPLICYPKRWLPSYGTAILTDPAENTFSVLMSVDEHARDFFFGLPDWKLGPWMRTSEISCMATWLRSGVDFLEIEKKLSVNDFLDRA
jgi:hypothetical protein